MIRKLALWIAGLVGLYALVGFLVVPPIARSQLERIAGELLGRPVVVERVRINPFTLSASIRNFAIKESDASADFVSFEDLSVDVTLSSLLRGGVVVEAVSLSKPRVRVVRFEDNRYSFQDILERFSASPSPPPAAQAAPPRFAVYNIRVTDGRVDFDDRPARAAHAVTDLQIGLPFISSLPDEVDIVVQPYLSAKVDGTPFGLTGKTKPFKDTHEATLQIDIERLELSKYLDYSPLPLRLRLPSGELNARLVVSYVARRGGRLETLAVSGTASLQRVAVTLADGAPLAKLRRASVELDSLDVFQRRASVKTVRIEAPEIDVVRGKDGQLTLADAFPPATSAATPQATQEEGFAFTVGSVTLTGGQIRFVDHAPPTPARVTLADIALQVDGLSSAPESLADVKLSARINRAARLQASAKMNPFSKALDLTASLRNFELRAMSPYSALYAGYGIERGTLSTKHAYVVQDRRLLGRNTIRLDQFTFGGKVDSPSATSLPVPLAVSLLKDRNGAIDLDVPVEGSVDDPQLRVRELIAHEVSVLIEHAITSPFAFLGSSFGGGADLAYVEFAPGSSVLDGASEAKLRTLAKALYERPGLRLELSGRAEPGTDRDALKRAVLDRQLRAEKVKAMGAKTADEAALAAVRIEPDEYGKYLGDAYRAAAFERPRDEKGALQDLPQPDMESLMLANAQVTDEDLRKLARARAQAAMDWLTEAGELAAQRVSIIPSTSTTDATRVDLALK